MNNSYYIGGPYVNDLNEFEIKLMKKLSIIYT